MEPLQTTQAQQLPQSAPVQTPSQSPAAPSTAGQRALDPQVVTLAKAIRQTESGGNFQAKGKSGEYGAYQWTAPTWEKMAAAAGLNVPLQQATPEQQNEVAYKQLAAWKSKGYNVGQIASMWNAGEGAPNAYINGNAGVNAEGVSYDTKKYAKDVATAYQQMKTGPQTAAPVSQPSTSITPQTTPAKAAAKESDGGLTGIPAIDSVADFLFPIAGDIKNDIQGKSSKSVLQQAGDLGLSALPLIPGLGDVGEGLRAAGVLGEGAGTLTKLLTGAATGYGYGSLSNLSQGQGLGEAFSPNAGNLGGAALGGVASAVLPKVLAPFAKNLTKSGAQSAVEDSLLKEAGRTKPTLRIMSEMPNGGKDAIETIARTPDAMPQVADDHHFDTAQGQQIMQQRAGQLSQLRANALTKMGTSFSLDELQKEALENLQANSKNAPDLLQRSEELAQTFSEYKRNYGDDKINPLQMEAIKEANPYASPIARAARKSLEDATQQSGAPDLKLLNKEIQRHIHAKAILEKMQGQVVKGGRIGNLLRRAPMDITGALAGATLGKGWVGTIGGALAGETLNSLLSRWQANTALTTPLQQAILERLAVEDPQIVQEYAKYASGKNTTPTEVTPRRAAPKKSATSGALRQLLMSSAARAPGAISGALQ